MTAHRETKVLIWDFDGTLAWREGMWTGALLQVLEQFASRRDVNADRIRPFLQTGFPWHSPDEPRTLKQSSDEWWRQLEKVFERAFHEGCAIESCESMRLAQRVRSVYTDLQFWRLFDDTISTLKTLLDHGWRHVILSNHVPELHQIIDGMGLSPLIWRIFNSAETGVEKPHPLAYQQLLNILPQDSQIWMIGDSYAADVLAAQRCGIQAILVRQHHPDATYCVERLADVMPIVTGTV